MKVEDFAITETKGGRVFVKIEIKIKNVKTNEIISTIEDVLWDEDEPILFGWTDGNMSCDCNRSGYFDNESDHCSEGRFLIKINNPVDGKSLYKEF